MNFKRTLIVTGIFAAILLFIFKFEVPHEEAKKQEGLVFSDIPMASVESIEIKRSGDVYTLTNKTPVTEKKDGEVSSSGDLSTWRLQGLPEARLDLAALNSIVSAISNLKFSSPVELEEGADLGVFGLKDPEISLQVKGAGKERTVILGKLSQYLNQRYAKVLDGNQIFLIADALYSAANKPASDIRSKAPITFDDSGIRQIALSTQNSKTVLEQGNDVGEEGSTWKIVEPYKASASSSTITEMLRELRGLQSKYFIDPPDAKPEAKGLDKPAVKLELTFKDDKKKPLSIALSEVKGEKGGASELFALISDQPTVFAMQSANADAFKKNADQLREKKLFAFDNWDTKEAWLRPTGGNALHLEKQGETWKVNGKEGDDTFINDYLREVSEVEAKLFPKSEETVEFKEPVLEIEVKLSSNKTLKFIIGKTSRSDGSYVAKRDGSDEPFFISQEQIKLLQPKEATLIKSNAERGSAVIGGAALTAQPTTTPPGSK